MSAVRSLVELSASIGVWASVGFLALSLVLAATVLAGGERPGWLRGYQKTISGEAISYHSPYPDSNSARIVRATDGRRTAEWQTAPVPADFAAPEATFIWMSGLGTGKGTHRFRLDINGADALTFTTSPDSSRRAWTVKGPAGVALSFETAMVDPFNDLFGFMLLTVPAALLRPSEPLRLRVTGEAAGSSDWFMVFEDVLAPGVRVKGEQVLVRKNGGLRQLLRVEVSHVAPPADAVITAAGVDQAKVRLATGHNVVNLSVPAADAVRDVSVDIDITGQPPQKIIVPVRPVTRREIWLLPHSHLDIGYSDRQPVVEKKHWRYYEEAIRLAEQSAGNPAGARFKWNVEQLWAVETYLGQAGGESRRRFIEAVRRGAIGLQATLAGELTGLCHPEELLHLTDFARRIARLTETPVDSVMVSDIPSQSWSLVPALALAGVKYISSGPNYMPPLPDGGDRIGWALKTWGDRPFYWVSPSGEHKVLFWMAGRGYSWFHGLHLGRIGCAPCQQIFDYLIELEARAYPYSMIQVRYTVGGDNGPPDADLADFVKRWNESYESPKLVIATTSEMFAEFERRHGAAVPTVRGDFTPYWEDGAASTAAETAANRNSAARLLQAETLWALVAPPKIPAAKLAEAWRQTVLFDEHTWGAADSISDPDGENARFQWDYKKGFAAEADRLSRELFEGARSVPGTGRSSPARAAVDVINTLSWDRTEVVVLPARMSAAGDAVKDAAGNAVPSQRLSTDDLAFLAANVPGLGAKRYFVSAGAPLSSGHARVRENGLDNGVLSATVDPGSGAVASLRWSNGQELELVDPGRYSGLNHYLYVAGRNPAAAAGPSGIRISPCERGPLVASLSVESDAPGARSLRREVRLCDGRARLDFADLLDKEKVRTKEGVHIAFPFCVPDGTVRVDAGWAFVRPGADQLPGACRDFFCAQNSVDISNQDYGVTWTPLDAPLVEVGEITDETPAAGGVRVWRRMISPSELLFSYAMNNYWHTNYKADQEGPVNLRYVVQPHAGFDTSVAKKLGLEAERPLIPVLADETRPVPACPLAIAPGPFVVTSLKPSADGLAWMMRVFNAGSCPAELRLSGPLVDRGRIYLSDLGENKAKWTAGTLEVPGFGIVTLRIAR
jgi:alpha-mannosidase